MGLTSDRGLFGWLNHIFNRVDPDRIAEAQALFDSLLAESPNYARAHAGLADVWNSLAIFGAVSRSEGYSRARESALRALEIDPDEDAPDVFTPGEEEVVTEGDGPSILDIATSDDKFDSDRRLE